MTVQSRPSAQREGRLGTLVGCSAVLALTAYLMRDWLRGGLPISPGQETIPELAITWMFREELFQGHLLSEWNPYWFSGFPWLRFLSYPLYYAVAALSAWGGLSLEMVMIVYYFLVTAASGLVMFGYLRCTLGDWRPALVGAVIYEAFPYHNHVGVETWIHAAFWVLLPLSLWLIELSCTDGLRRINYLLSVGVVVGCFPIVSSEYTIVAGPFVALYLVWRGLVGVARGKHSLPRVLGGFALIGVVALGSAAFFALPGLLEVQHVGIHAKHGAASTFTDELLADYAVTPGLVWYAIARRFRLPTSNEGLPGIVRRFWSITWYPGAIASALAVLGLGALRRRFMARFAVVGLLLSALLSSGPACALNFFSYLPVLGQLSPFRGMLLVVTWLSVLSALGVSWILLRLHGRFGQWVLVVATLLLVMIDFGPSSSAYQTAESYFDRSDLQAYSWLGRHADSGRLWEVATRPRDRYLYAYSLSEAPMLRYCGYYDNGAPLYTHQQVAWTELSTSLRLHQVRYVLLREKDPGAYEARTKLRDMGYRVAFESDGVQIWESPKVVGYAQFYTAAALDVTQDYRRSLAALPQFVRQGVAMVAADSLWRSEPEPDEVASYEYIFADDLAADDRQRLGDILPAASARTVSMKDLQTIESAAQVEVTAYAERIDYDHIYLTVSASESGLLSIAESWYPHWRVFVDGRPRQVQRVNWALLGVWLEAGDHRIEFRFQRPWYVSFGYAVTGVTLLALVSWWTWYWGRALNRPEAALVGQTEASDGTGT